MFEIPEEHAIRSSFNASIKKTLVAKVFSFWGKLLNNLFRNEGKI
jgi:hypothetical protein